MSFAPPTKVHAALKNLSKDDAGSELLREELELKKTMAAAATALQCKCLETGSTLEMKKNATLLSLQGVDLPTPNKLHYTRRVSSVHLADNELDAWVACLSLLSKCESTPAWDPNKPTFGMSVKGLVVEDAAWSLAQELYVGACFPDAWMRLLTPGAGGAHQQEIASASLLKVCRAFLRQYVDEQPEVSGPAKTMMDNVAKVMRGMVALASPIPEDEGSTVTDVEYVNPRNATTAPILTEPTPRWKAHCQQVAQRGCLFLSFLFAASSCLAHFGVRKGLDSGELSCITQFAPKSAATKHASMQDTLVNDDCNCSYSNLVSPNAYKHRPSRILVGVVCLVQCSRFCPFGKLALRIL